MKQNATCSGLMGPDEDHNGRCDAIGGRMIRRDKIQTGAQSNGLGNVWGTGENRTWFQSWREGRERNKKEEATGQAGGGRTCVQQ